MGYQRWNFGVCCARTLGFSVPVGVDIIYGFVGFVLPLEGLGCIWRVWAFWAGVWGGFLAFEFIVHGMTYFALVL